MTPYRAQCTLHWNDGASMWSTTIYADSAEAAMVKAQTMADTYAADHGTTRSEILIIERGKQLLQEGT